LNAIHVVQVDISTILLVLHFKSMHAIMKVGHKIKRNAIILFTVILISVTLTNAAIGILLQSTSLSAYISTKNGLFYSHLVICWWGFQRV